MKAHITEQETQLHDALVSNLRKARQAGLANGAKAVSGVILKFATDTTISEHERLQAIIQFCRKGLDIKEDLGIER